MLKNILMKNVKKYINESIFLVVYYFFKSSALCQYSFLLKLYFKQVDLEPDIAGKKYFKTIAKNC